MLVHVVSNSLLLVHKYTSDPASANMDYALKSDLLCRQGEIERERERVCCPNHWLSGYSILCYFSFSWFLEFRSWLLLLTLKKLNLKCQILGQICLTSLPFRLSICNKEFYANCSLNVVLKSLTLTLIIKKTHFKHFLVHEAWQVKKQLIKLTNETDIKRKNIKCQNEQQYK